MPFRIGAARAFWNGTSFWAWRGSAASRPLRQHLLEAELNKWEDLGKSGGSMAYEP